MHATLAKTPSSLSPPLKSSEPQSSSRPPFFNPFLRFELKQVAEGKNQRLGKTGDIEGGGGVWRIEEE